MVVDSLADSSVQMQWWPTGWPPDTVKFKREYDDFQYFRCIIKLFFLPGTEFYIFLLAYICDNLYD
jgi:hypothetical protein